MLVALPLFAPDPADAWQLLQQSVSAYQSLKSYSDEGFATVPGPHGAENYPLKSKYLRGTGAVVRWQTGVESETIWSSKGEAYRLVESKNIGDASTSQFIVHLGPYRVSDSTTGFLDPDAARTRWLCNLLASNLSPLPPLATRDRILWHSLDPQKVDGAMCDVVGRGQTKIFIDAKSHLVRRIESQSNGSTPVAIQVKPRANVRVSERDVSFRPPAYESTRLPAPKDKPATYAGASHGFKTYEDIVQTVSEHYLYDNMEDEFSVMSGGFAGPFSASTNHLIRRADGAFCLTSSNPTGASSTLWSNGVEAKEWSVLRSQEVSLCSVNRQETAEGAVRRAILNYFKNWPVRSSQNAQAIVHYDTVTSTFSANKIDYQGKRVFQIRVVRVLRPSPGGAKDVTENLRWLVSEDGFPILEEWREGNDMSREPFYSVKHSAHLVPRPRWNQIEYRPAPVDLMSFLSRPVARKQD